MQSYAIKLIGRCRGSFLATITTAVIRIEYQVPLADEFLLCYPSAPVLLDVGRRRVDFYDLGYFLMINFCCDWKNRWLKFSVWNTNEKNLRKKIVDNPVGPASYEIILHLGMSDREEKTRNDKLVALSHNFRELLKLSRVRLSIKDSKILAKISVICKKFLSSSLFF